VYGVANVKMPRDLKTLTIGGKRMVLETVESEKVCGESAAVGDDVANEWKINLSELLERYIPRDVFNADETALFL